MANNLKAVIDQAYEQGKNTYSTFRKVSAISTVAGYWVDMSMTTGSPKPNYYVGAELEATIPSSWYKSGIWHGGDVSPEKKFLHKMSILASGAAGTPCPLILCDYLMYYPLIDMDSTDVQVFDNSSNSLPRYSDGLGVQMFVVATNPYIGGQTFQVTYTNSEGVSGRVTQLCLSNSATYIGTIINSHTAGLRQYQAFVPLQAGDNGIQSVQEIVFHGANGGLATLVLVKPLATVMTREIGAFAEFDFLKNKPSFPRIYDGAYLNFILMPPGSIPSVAYLGELTTIWTS